MSNPNENLPLPDDNVPGELSLSPTVPTPDEAVPEAVDDAPSDASPTDGDSSNSGEGASPGLTEEGQKRDKELQDLIKKMSVESTSLGSPDSTSTGTVSVQGSSKTPTLSTTDPEDGSSVLGTPSSDTGEGALSSDQLLKEIQSKLILSKLNQSSAQTQDAPVESDLKMEIDSESPEESPDGSPDEPKQIVEKPEEATPGTSQDARIEDLPSQNPRLTAMLTQDSPRTETDFELPTSTTTGDPEPIVKKRKKQTPGKNLAAKNPELAAMLSSVTEDSRGMETDSESPEETPEGSPDEPKPIVEKPEEATPGCSVSRQKNRLLLSMLSSDTQDSRRIETDSERPTSTTTDDPKPIDKKRKKPTPRSSIPSQPTLPKVIPSSVTEDSRRMDTDSGSPKDTLDGSPDEPKPIAEEEQEPHSLTPLPKYVTSPPTKLARKMETESPKDTTEDSFDEPKAVVKEQAPRSSIHPMPHPESGSSSRSNSASGSLMVSIPLSILTRQPESPKNDVSGEKSKSKLGSDGDDSSLGSISQVGKPYKGEMSKIGDSSDGSKPGSEADESSQSCCASPDTHRRKALHKKVHRDATGTTPSLKAIRDHHQPALSRADTLSDVETIRTDSGSRQISPDRDRRAVSVPADPPRIDPRTAPEERRAYSEAKETEMKSEEVMETDNFPEPPYPSLETSSFGSVSLPTTDSERQVQSEPVKGWAKVVPVKQTRSEGHTPASSLAEFSDPGTSCIPEERMLEDPRVGDDYAGDRSASTSDVDPMRERPRREDREAERQLREFNEALAAAGSSSGRGTDSNVPSSSTLGTSEENRLAPIIGGYHQGWFKQPAENPVDEDDQSESKSSSEQSASTSSGMADFYQTVDSYFRPGPEGEPQPGPSGLKSKDLLEVIPEKGESICASPKSLSPVFDEEHPKTTEKEDDEATEVVEPDEATEMAKPEEDAKSRMAQKLKDEEGQRTPKRKRDRKKSRDSPKDPEVHSPDDDSRKRYCSEFSRPVVTERRVRRCSTGSVTPFQAQNVSVDFRELAKKSVKKETKKDDPKDKKEPKDESKDEKDPKDRQGPSA